jgi:hypothetical protein
MQNDAPFLAPGTFAACKLKVGSLVSTQSQTILASRETQGFERHPVRSDMLPVSTSHT